MRAITGSSGKGCVLIILFQLCCCCSKAGLFESNYSPLPNHHIGRKSNPMSNLLKIPSQKNVDIILQMPMSLVFLQHVQVKKSKKMAKIVKIEEVAKKQSFILSSDSIFFKIQVKAWIFKENFNISFCQISNFLFYLNKNELRTNCQENHQVKGMTHICCFVFARIRHVRHVTLARVRDHIRQFYSNCQTLKGTHDAKAMCCSILLRVD